MKNIGILSSILILAFFSCKKNAETDQNSDILPMNSANSWTYSDTVFHYYSHYFSVDTFVSEFAYHYCVKGYCGFRSRPIEDFNKSVSLVNSDPDGNFVEIIVSQDSLLYNSVRYKKNPVKGEKWIFHTAIYTNDDYINFTIDEIEMTCLNTDTLIYTPKRTFKCNVFSHSPDNNKDTFIEYLSDGVGIVMSCHYEGNNLFTKSTLIDYSLH